MTFFILLLGLGFQSNIWVSISMEYEAQPSVANISYILGKFSRKQLSISKTRVGALLDKLTWRKST